MVSPTKADCSFKHVLRGREELREFASNCSSSSEGLVHVRGSRSALYYNQLQVTVTGWRIRIHDSI